MTSIDSTKNEASQALLDAVNGVKNATSSTDDVQDRFMTLLVEQMKNQDPLNPMDNAQVTTQMAQLSTVSGIDKLNETLESLIGNVAESQSYQAANMIGHDVLVNGNKLSHTGEGGKFGIDLPIGADKVTVDIKNSAGVTVRTMELGEQQAGILPLSWDGYNNDGAVAANGNYQISVAASVNNQTAEATALSFAKVLSVNSGSNGVKLNLSDASSVSTSDIKEIY